MSRADEIMAKLGKAKVSYNQCCGAATFLARGPGADSGSWQKKRSRRLRLNTQKFVKFELLKY